MRQARSAIIRTQAEKMLAGPRLADDGITLVIPSDWYNEDATSLWKKNGFQWDPDQAHWTRNTREPLRSRIFTADVWLERARARFFEFWPTLVKKKLCARCRQPFTTKRKYRIYCRECKKEMHA